MVVASLRLLVLILSTRREMQWGILLFLNIRREVAPVTGQPAADTTAGPKRLNFSAYGLELGP